MAEQNSKLERLADPTKWHIMPSGRSLEEKSMPPPRILRKRQKVVLNEDDYVKSLNKIIERDFFPDIPKLKRQLEWMEAVENRDFAKMQALRASIPTALRQDPAGAATPAGSATPLTSINNPTSADGKRTAEAIVGDVNRLGLDAFQLRYASEDNDSFSDLAEKQAQEHRQKYWWVFDPDAKQKAMKLLRNGTELNNPEFVKLITDRLAGKEIDDGTVNSRDDRVNKFNEWTTRAQNHLMWPPSLEQSNDICRVSEGTKRKRSEQQLLLTGAGGGRLAGGTALVKANGGIAPAKQISHNSTRVASAVRQEAREFERKARDAQNAALGISSIGQSAADADGFDLPSGSGSRAAASDKGPTVGGYSFVASTPAIDPGAAGDTPLMTWGEVAGTPLMLEPDVALPGGKGPGKFRISNKDTREKALYKLEASYKAKRKATSARQATTPMNLHGGAGSDTPNQTPLSGRRGAVGGSGHSVVSSASRLSGASHLTGASAVLAAKLAKGVRRSKPSDYSAGNLAGVFSASGSYGGSRRPSSKRHRSTQLGTPH